MKTNGINAQENLISYIVAIAIFMEFVDSTALNTGLTGTMLIQLGLYAPLFIIPLMLQAVYGFSAFKASFFMAVNAGGFLFARKFADRLLNMGDIQIKIYCYIILYSIVLMSFSYSAFYFSSPAVCFSLFFTGIFTALLAPQVGALNYTYLGKELFSQGTSILSTAGQLSSSFSVALSAFFISVMLPQEIYEVHSLPTAAFKLVFFIIGFFPILSLYFYWNLFKENDQPAFSKVH